MQRRRAAAVAALAALMRVGAAAEGPFGIRGGKIHEVEVSLFVVVRYGTGNGWTIGAGRAR